MNDLWKYNTNTDLWTWINGSDAVDQPAYGTKVAISCFKYSGGRYGAVELSMMILIIILAF
ncbi:MAG: hypothetical protein H6611_00900 [Ignavibacteriales bacterium]|nr:hypothetical protein [Ignavibacteriales bacterium]